MRYLFPKLISINNIGKAQITNGTNQVETFLEQLATWDGKNLIPEDKLDNVSFVADLEITSWKYNDLVLKPYIVKAAIIEKTTRSEKISNIAIKFTEIATLTTYQVRNYCFIYKQKRRLLQ